MLPTIPNATGALLWARAHCVDWEQLVRSSSQDITLQPLPNPGWIWLTLTSDHALVPEEEQRNEYQYHYLVRSGTLDRFLLVSSEVKLVWELLNRLGIRRSSLRATIKVHDLVVNLCEKPGIYALSAVHARIEGFGQALRSTAFYGNDVGDALLFRELLDRMDVHRVTLREVTKRQDIISIGEKGDISFTYTHENSLRDIDQALRFMSARGFLSWTVEK